MPLPRRRKSWAQQLLLTLICAAIAGLAIHPNDSTADSYHDLPSIGASSDAVLPPDEEKRIGRETVRQLRELNYIFDDNEIETYLNELGRRIASHSDRPIEQFRFFVIRDQQINAFALPGGYIGVNAGLIGAARSESELAGVLAHEIAHVTQRHIARQIQSNGRFQIATAAALLLAILAGASDPDVVQAAMSVGIAATGQQQINFTRAHESEADRVGIQFMTEAGFDPNGMATFFQYMAERSRLYGNQLPEILQSHPVSNTRIAEAMQRISQLPKTTPPDPTEFQLMQARLRVMSLKQASSALEYYSPTESAPSQVRQYALALGYYRAGQYPRALEGLQALAKANPTNAHFALALAQLRLASSQPASVVPTLQALLEKQPSYGPLILLTADTLLQSRQPEDARALLKNHVVPTWEQAEMHRLLAQAAQQQKNLPEAFYQMAEHYRDNDDYDSALDQVEAGLSQTKLSTIDNARLSTLKKNLEKEAPEVVERRKRERHTS